MRVRGSSRRQWMAAVAGAVFGGLARAWASAPPCRVTRIETCYWKSREDAPFWPHWTWVRLETDSGHAGVGETYPRGSVEATLIHDHVAGLLLGQDPRDIERLWADLYHRFDFQVMGGAEMRVLSAVNLALWDLLGKMLEVPVYRLLGGKSNPRIRLYNTCFPYKYDFHREPERIMQELLDRYGVRAIKIWPFDEAGQRHRRQYITEEEIEQGLRPVRKLRERFGNEIEILVEFHSYWDVTSAIRIARALEPYRPMWLEDMLLPGNLSAYRQLAEATALPLAAGERMAGRYQFEQLLASGAVRYVMFDVCWCGGLSEAVKIAAMAAARQLPIAPHTAGGPLLFYASTHLTTAATNVAIQESVQRFYESDWPQMLVRPLVPEDGHVSVPELPGFGMEIRPEVWNHPRAVKRVSQL